jgi:hypothetical protein
VAVIIKWILTNKCHKPIGIGGMSSASMSDSRMNFDFTYSPFMITLQTGYERIFSVVKNESFVFVVNGEEVQSNAIDAVLISAKVHESLRSTPGNFRFIINDESINATIFEHFLELVIHMFLEIFHEMNSICL